jgi:hypothetical protein
MTGRFAGAAGDEDPARARVSAAPDVRGQFGEIDVAVAPVRGDGEEQQTVEHVSHARFGLRYWIDEV